MGGSCLANIPVSYFQLLTFMENPNLCGEKRGSFVTLAQQSNHDLTVQYLNEGQCECCEDAEGTPRECHFCIHKRVYDICSCLCDQCHDDKLQEEEEGEKRCPLCNLCNTSAIPTPTSTRTCSSCRTSVGVA